MDIAFMTLLLGLGFLLFVLAVIWYILQAIAYWKVFTKAGEKGWKSLIPFYSSYIQFKITWEVKYFWIWILCIMGLLSCPADGGFFFSIASWLFEIGAFVITAVSAFKLSEAYGHGMPFALGLFFLKPIFTLILGFGSSQYMGPQGSNRFRQTY